MPVIDLITPWAADPTGAPPRLRGRLEAIRRQRAPTEATLPPPPSFDPVAGRARDTSLHQRLRSARERLAEQGLRFPAELVLVASAAPGPAAEPLPDPSGDAVALFLDRADDDGLVAALAGAMAALTRWSQPASPLAPLAGRPGWDRWAAAREVPLLEWCYTAGLGVHARALVTPDAAPHDLLGLSAGALTRLRQDERALLALLDDDLPRTGAGVVLRWLEDDAPPALRRGDGDLVIPPGAGRYLAWRELRDRVARVGVAEACTLEAS